MGYSKKRMMCMQCKTRWQCADFQGRFFVGGFYLIGNLRNCNVWEITTMLRTRDSTNVRS